MGTYREVEGDLIKLALEGVFDVITHGVNCFCVMKSGIAPQMAKAFGCDKFPKERMYDIEIGLDGLEHPIETNNRGDINKLGTIDYQTKTYAGGTSSENIFDLTVVNSYTQYKYGINHKDGMDKPLDYDAITMCMRKINHLFKGKHIGLPKIGSGLGGGIWSIDELSLSDQNTRKDLPYKDIKSIIQEELKDCDVTVVILNLNK